MRHSGSVLIISGHESYKSKFGEKKASPLATVPFNTHILSNTGTLIFLASSASLATVPGTARISEEKRAELRFVIDYGDCYKLGHEGPSVTALHLGDWSLEESIRRAAIEATRQMKMHNWNDHGIDVASKDFIDMSIKQFQPFVSLLLYLCSANGEIRPLEGKTPGKSRPRKTKRGPRLFPPDHVSTWDVGVRMGTAIRGAVAAISKDHGGTHANPRPHIRRAHWHTYWVGKKGKREPILKWLAPILVGANGDLPVTIRPVK